MGVGLLASASAPLVALLAVLKVHDLGWVSWVILVTCLAAILLLVFVLRSLAGIQARSVETTSVRRADERVLAFTSSYVLAGSRSIDDLDRLRHGGMCRITAGVVAPSTLGIVVAARNQVACSRFPNRRTSAVRPTTLRETGWPAWALNPGALR